MNYVKKSIDYFVSTFWLPLHSSDNSIILYHYTSAEGLEGIIKERAFRFSHIMTLNDPLELVYGKNLIIYNIESFIKKENDKFVLEVLEDLIMLLNAYATGLYHTFVACFCEEANLLSQWRGYANKGGGYNIGIIFNDDVRFNHQIDKLDEKNITIPLRKVLYEEEIQNDIIKKCIRNVIGGIKKAAESNISGASAHEEALSIVNILIEIMLTFKNKVFSEENEWRLISVSLAGALPELIKFRTSNGYLVPYINTYIYTKENEKLLFPVESIKYGPSLEETRTDSALDLFLVSESKANHPIKINAGKIKLVSSGYQIRN